MRIRVLSIVAFFMFLPACKDEITLPKNEPFMLRVNVVDDTGQPVPGLFVTAWNLLSAEMARSSATPASTWFSFAVPQSSHLRVEVFHLNGDRFATAYEARGLTPGSYRILWQMPPNTHDGGYVCKFIFLDAHKGDRLYKDSIIAYHATDRVFDNIVGITDSNGVMETRERVIFPSLFNLPDLPLRLPNDNGMMFSILDRAVIGLGYRPGGSDQRREVDIHSGTNEISLVLSSNESIHLNDLRSEASQREAGFWKLKRIEGQILTENLEWSVSQNKPNPF